MSTTRRVTRSSAKHTAASADQPPPSIPTPPPADATSNSDSNSDDEAKSKKLSSAVGMLEDEQDASTDDEEQVDDSDINDSHLPPPVLPRIDNRVYWTYNRDLALAKATHAYMPYTAGLSKSRNQWVLVQRDVTTGLSKEHSVDVLQSRMRELIRKQRQDDNKAAKKSGASEDVTELTQILSDIVASIDGVKAAQIERTAKEQARREKWAAAGAQARDAAFIGVSRREDHVDMYEGQEASTRDLQSQRKRAAKRDMPTETDDKENRPAKRQKQDDLMQALHKTDMALIERIDELEEKREKRERKKERKRREREERREQKERKHEAKRDKAIDVLVTATDRILDRLNRLETLQQRNNNI